MSSGILSLRQAVRSSVGRKILMGLSGGALVFFVVTHLLGNLKLYWGDAEGINAYAHQLSQLGFLFALIEAGLFGTILLHAFTGVRLKLGHHDARPIGYAVTRSKAGPSQSNVASRNMIISGVLLLLFIGVHVKQFRFGPGIEDGYVAEVKGEVVRDVYRVVAEAFQSPWVVAFYVISMSVLGAHLRHGFWSALQSLGLLNDRNVGALRAFGVLLAVVLAVGFLFIPVFMFVKSMN